MKKFLKFTLALLTLFTFTGCKNLKGEQGPQGPQGQIGPIGPQGEKGDTGEDGVSITVVSIDKTASENNVDTYTITFSDGSKTSFNVSNGADGKSVKVSNLSILSSINGVDTYQIEFNDGFKTTFEVKNGKSVSVESLNKVSSEGIYDKYRISFSDGSFSEFTVTNGETPYIGDNGNWWIKDVDTGVVADVSKKDKRIPTLKQLLASSGLIYQPISLNGVSGLIVNDYKSSQAFQLLGLGVSKDCYYKYEKLVSFEEYLTMIEDIKYGNVDIIVPNYVGSVPVIGMGACFNDSSISSISLSNNTQFISIAAFEECYQLRNVDFNDCPITQIPGRCFGYTALRSVKLPETVTTLCEYCFNNTFLIDINLENITVFGNSCLDKTKLNYVFLSNKTKYVGSAVFYDTFKYVEEGTDCSEWENYGEDSFNEEYFFNCKRNNEYIYSENDNEITLYQYIGNDRVLNIPSSIENKNVTKLGQGFLFDKFINEKINYYNYGTILGNYLESYDEIIIPNTVKLIDRNTLNPIGSLIYIPKSVERIYYNVSKTSHPYICLAFEGNNEELPIAFNDVGDIIDPYNEIMDYEEMNYRTSIDLSKLYFDEESRSFYLEDEGTYSLLSVLDLDCINLEIPSTINDKAVSLIETNAVYSLPNIKTIKIGDNIKKIRTNAFNNLTVKSAFIPNTVNIINHLAFNIQTNQYVVGNNVLPEDWDHEFCKSGNHRFIYNCNDIKYGYECGFIYEVIDSKVTLLEFISYSDEVVIPSIIEGKEVTAINSGFISIREEIQVYIPTSVTKAQSYAFTSSNKYYFEASEVPQGFESLWDNGDSTIYTSFEFDQCKKYGDFIYEEVENSIILIKYYGNDTDIYIPRTINGKDVVEISPNFFSYTRYITNVYIPDTVKVIGLEDNYAFVPFKTRSSYTINFYFEIDYNPVLTRNLLDSINQHNYYWNQEIDK